MSFWSENEAAPHWIYTCLPKTPRFLRTHPVKPRITPSAYSIRRARPDDVDAVAAFWRTHYKGDDWYMDARPEWVRTYVCDPSVIVLVAYDATAQLIATIVSTPLNGTVYMSHGASLRNTVRVIEGLVVHSAHRGKGVAGAMIHEMDVLTSTRAPTCHLWSREIPYEPFVTTAIQTSTYAYIPCGAAAAVAHATATCAPWADFQRFWTQHVASVLRRRTPYLVLDTVNPRRDDMTVWKVVVRECVHIVVVSNTRRKQVSTDAPVFELVWIGAPQQTHVREALECVAAQLASGVLFVSCADETWPSPWQYGTSGAHAWYMYNYMPPAFGSVEIHAIREEL